MANPMLALIGAITLSVLGAGCLIALVILSAQGFLALGRKLSKLIHNLR
jgi:hypothetical protein